MKIISFKLISVILILFSGCSKEMGENSLIGTEWKVESISVLNQDPPQISPKPYSIKFLNDSTIRLLLDVNECFSTYTLGEENSINIDPFACTLVCCDSDFAISLTNMLKDVTEYKIINEELELFVSYRIINLHKVAN